MASLIFVAVAVAWALYLIPKALQSHEHAVRARSVERFSHTMRVLARREPVDHRNSRLVVQSGRGAGSVAAVAEEAAVAAPESAPESARAFVPSPAQLRTRRDAARRAAKRRRRVLVLLLVTVAAVAGVAASRAIEWWYVAIPAGLLVAWLVACRLMVKGEHRAWDRLVAPPAEQAGTEPAEDEELTTALDTATLADSMTDPGMWDPVPVTLPTYVSMAAATRTVRTIDLDADGVWTSGRTEADSALARQSDAADQAARATRKAEGDEPRAVGSTG